MSQDDNANQYLLKGKLEYKNGDYSSCIRSLHYAQQLFDAMNNKEASAESLVLMGHTYLKLEQRERAAQVFVDALIRFKEVNNNQKLGECALVLGMIYRDIVRSIPKSKTYLQQAIDAFSKENDLEKMGDSWRALAFARQNNPKQFLEKAYEIHNNYLTAIELYKKGKLDEKHAKTNLELAQYLLAQSKFMDAEKHLLVAFTYYDENQMYNTLLTIRINLIRIYLEIGKKVLARDHYEKALEQMRIVGCTSERIERLKGLFE